jgi:hypothetical protein
MWIFAAKAKARSFVGRCEAKIFNEDFCLEGAKAQKA